MDYPLTIIDHPLAAHKLTLMRDAGCDSAKFRQLVYELGLMLAIGATAKFPLSGWRGTDFEGRPYEGRILEQWNVVAVPVLRSGLVLGEAFTAVLPSARTGHLGIHHDYADDRDAVTYMVSVPSVPELTDFFVIDSLIGTGETMKLAVAELRALEVPPERIRLLVLSVHEQGLARFYDDEAFAEAHRDIPTFAFERRADTDERGLPAFGFGNVADRIYGTGASHGHDRA